MPFYRHRFDRIEEYLHHRPPYLLVEEIEEIREDSITTSKLVREGDFFLQGHFPGAPIFPGAMMQELVTQSAGILLAANYNPLSSYDTEDPNHNEYALGVLIKVRGARYRGFARPNDQMTVDVQLNEITESLFDFTGQISVNQKEIMRIDFLLSNIPSKTLVG